MGLFENLGRKVEEFKQSASEVSKESASHVCADCENLMYTSHDECPECGSENVRERDTE